MLKSWITNRIASSASQIDISDVSNGTLSTSSNLFCKVLSVSSVNFELKSEEEQDALIDTFKDFLNSTSFAVQFLVRVREVDIDDYLDDINKKILHEDLPIFKVQLKNYHKFIANLVVSNKILTRTFYVVIPFETNKKDKLLVDNQLSLRVDMVSKNLARLGISAKELKSIEIIDLFYSFYNPNLSKIQSLSSMAFSVADQDFIKAL